jgi:septal ring factor EnvC (AmiA/AmiB activator)
MDMKKIVSIFVLAFIFFALPFEISYGKTAVDTSKDQFSSQIKEKKKLINRKIKATDKIQAQINKKGKTAADLYMSLFSGDMTPSEEDSKKVEMMEMQLGNLAEELNYIEKSLSAKVKAVNNSLKLQNYNQALSIYDIIIALMDKETLVLQKENETLQTYINLLESLRHK